MRWIKPFFYLSIWRLIGTYLFVIYFSLAQLPTALHVAVSSTRERILPILLPQASSATIQVCIYTHIYHPHHQSHIYHPSHTHIYSTTYVTAYISPHIHHFIAFIHRIHIIYQQFIEFLYFMLCYFQAALQYAIQYRSRLANIIRILQQVSLPLPHAFTPPYSRL
jgi:hypothetical protein